MAAQTVSPVAARATASGSRDTLRLVVGSFVLLFAAALLAGGGWALWKDRVDRDSSGLLSTGSIRLDTDTSAIVGELRGDGPGWLYGASILGDGRVRATSVNGEPLFVGIARDEDLSRYLAGAGYATIQNFGTSARTTHPGEAPTHPPMHASIWAASTEGTGQQTLRWRPKEGDWSIVLMNADAGPGVAVRGDLSAEFPPLPWLAGALLILGTAVAVVAGRWLLGGLRA